jgi:hypothetical protein
MHYDFPVHQLTETQVICYRIISKRGEAVPEKGAGAAQPGQQKIYEKGEHYNA